MPRSKSLCVLYAVGSGASSKIKIMSNYKGLTFSDEACSSSVSKGWCSLVKRRWEVIGNILVSESITLEFNRRLGMTYRGFLMWSNRLAFGKENYCFEGELLVGALLISREVLAMIDIFMLAGRGVALINF